LSEGEYFPIKFDVRNITDGPFRLLPHHKGLIFLSFNRAWLKMRGSVKGLLCIEIARVSYVTNVFIL